MTWVVVLKIFRKTLISRDSTSYYYFYIHYKQQHKVVSLAS